MNRLRLMIFFWAIVGGVIVIALGLAARYDHRAKRRGLRVGVSTEEAFQHRMDVESMNNPMVQGGKEDWMTWRKRDQK